jgi:serine/threonine-protein kinase
MPPPRRTSSGEACAGSKNMADDKWQKVREIFDAALRQQPEARADFLRAACGDDESLLAEVQSLFSSYDKAEDFLATPAVAQVAEMIEADQRALETGQTVGPYEIIGPLGSGGMGEVYLAKDRRLGRQVAVKVLNEKYSGQEANLARFVQEAKAASALNHPNILVIYEIGEAGDAPFIVSEFVEGQTLRAVLRERALSLAEVMDIALQAANALVAAHAARIIHRDIKPENLMLRPDGLVKALDFGLAKLVEPPALDSHDPTFRQEQTASGVILGTANYMSPEQAKGERVDARTDIFSLGALLYEMVAGRAPFAGDSMAETLANVINMEAPPLARMAANVPEELQRIVAKMLRKDRQERYQTMRDALTDLKNLRENLASEAKLERAANSDPHATTVVEEAATRDAPHITAATQRSFSQHVKRRSVAAVALAALLVGAVVFGWRYFGPRPTNTKPIESIAVLPLENLSGDASQEYFADGMTDAVITELAKIGSLRVISRNSTMQYKGARKKTAEIARELNVDGVIEGTVLRSGDKVRISLQMFRAANDQNVWSNSYERDLRDVLALQSEVSRGIVSEIKVKLTPQEQAGLTSKRAVKPEANDAFFRGRYYFYQAINNAPSESEQKETFQKSFAAYQQAISIEPNYAEVYAALATAYHWSVPSYPGSEFYPKSIEAAQKALQIDETNAQAHHALAYCIWNYNWDAVTAEKEYKRAIELDANEGHGGYALLLSQLGRHDEAMREMQLAMNVDPLNSYLKFLVAPIHINARQYDKASEQCRRVIALNPTQPDYQRGLALSLTYQGKYQEAVAEAQKYLKMIKASPEDSLDMAWIYAMAGRREEALKIVNEHSKRPEEKQDIVALARVYAALGDRDQAIFRLEKAVSLRTGLRGLKVSPAFDNLRDDPRFAELVRRAGL